MNQLDAIKKFTTIVADSCDIESIHQYYPMDATTNPSLVLKAVSLNNYHYLIEDAINYAQIEGGNKRNKIINASDKLSVNIGLEILKIIPGHISTEIDVRFSFNRSMCISKAEKIIKLYEESGVKRSRVLIKIAATWEGIRAAAELEKKGINCNLTLIFSLAQARACAEAGVYLISPFIGRIYDWHIKNNTKFAYQSEIDPGVKFVCDVYHYYKKHKYNTIIMGSSFRNINQILQLAGCDKLTISPDLLKKLQSSNLPVNRRLFPLKEFSQKPSSISEAEYRWQHNQNAMAVEKLSDGIRQFAVDQERLESILENKI